MEDCDCPGQLLVSDDCVTGAFCQSTQVRTIDCSLEGPDYLLAVDFSTWSWECKQVNDSLYTITVESGLYENNHHSQSAYEKTLLKS